MPQRIDVPGHGIVEFPDGMSDDQIVSAIKANTPQSPTAQPKRSWLDVPGEAVKNLIPSAANFAAGIGHAVMHPIDTAGNILDIGAGALHNALPSSVSSAIDSIDPNPQAGARAVAAADAAGKFYKDRYGSMEGVKNTLSTDPVGVAADVSTVLTGGAGMAAKIPQAAKYAEALRAAGAATNPITPAVRVGQGVGNVAGLLGSNALGLTTGVGPEAIKTAFVSGLKGDSSFMANLNGDVPKTDVLDAVKQNLYQMAKDKAAEYRNGMAQVSGDKSILSFDGIDQAVKDAAGISTFKGQTKNARAAQVTQDIADAVSEWKKLPAEEFHTPEGLDALKQKIGGMVESIPFEEKTARLAAGKIYNAVKDEITAQAPTYADTMKAYSDATEQIREIERALSAGQKASADTGMRKLQSLMRNNVNTNYGNRLDLANTMVEKGGTDIFPALAGQAMNSWLPRGLAGQAEGLGTLYAAFHNPSLAALLPIQSPKAVGATLYAMGRGGKSLSDMASKSGLTPEQAKMAAMLLGQAGRQRQ